MVFLEALEGLINVICYPYCSLLLLRKLWAKWWRKQWVKVFLWVSQWAGRGGIIFWFFICCFQTTLWYFVKMILDEFGICDFFLPSLKLYLGWKLSWENISWSQLGLCGIWRLWLISWGVEQQVFQWNTWDYQWVLNLNRSPFGMMFWKRWRDN